MPVIYLDNHATTPVDPRVIDAMMPCWRELAGNPSATHAHGKQAKAAVDAARERVAALIGAGPSEVVFTSGATESNNLALRGVARVRKDRGDHIVTFALEHKSVLDTVKSLEAEGFHVTVLKAPADGVVRVDDVAAALTPRTVLVSIMAANNEIGTVQPIAAIGALCRSRGVLFHCDAAQAPATMALDVEEMQIDLMSLSAHKMYGPMGIGALYVRQNPRVDLQVLFTGGGQERGMRPGTLNVPGIVGFGTAAVVARAERVTEAQRLASLRDRLLGRLRALPHVHVHGSMAHRLPGNLSIAFDFVEARALLGVLEPFVSLSAGSACTATSLSPSHVLSALGVPRDRAQSTVRIGVGRFTTSEEIDQTAALLEQHVARLRDESPIWRAMGPQAANRSTTHA